jgi:riboflavin kinase
VKPYHVETLKAIALLGGTKEYVSLSSGELGKLIGVSQQSASQRILELIRDGLVARDLATRRQRIRLTPRGAEVLRKEYADYQRIFEAKETLTISGAVASGLGEGAFYMRQKGYKDQFRKKLWFEPYEGTLNLKLTGADLAKLRILQDSPGIEISGFEAAGRTFGGAKCFLATAGRVDCAVIMPIRTHHTDVLEVISKHYLRNALGLKDGDVLELTVSL